MARPHPPALTEPSVRADNLPRELFRGEPCNALGRHRAGYARRRAGRRPRPGRRRPAGRGVRAGVRAPYPPLPAGVRLGRVPARRAAPATRARPMGPARGRHQRLDARRGDLHHLHHHARPGPLPLGQRRPLHRAAGAELRHARPDDPRALAARRIRAVARRADRSAGHGRPRCGAGLPAGPLAHRRQPRGRRHQPRLPARRPGADGADGGVLRARRPPARPRHRPALRRPRPARGRRRGLPLPHRHRRLRGRRARGRPVAARDARPGPGPRGSARS